MRLGVGAAVVEGRLVRGDVAVENGLVAAVGLAPGAAPEHVAVPGLVDVHINGIAGVDFLAADADGYARAGEALAATGVVAYQPTFISSPVEAVRAALAEAGGAARGGRPELVGVHLEGPFLSERWRGAHDARNLLAPDVALAESLCDAGPVTMVTLAPELPGGLELVRALVARGVVVSLGHSDADAESARAAFDAGARAVTHVHNAQRRWAARDPGLPGAALVDPRATVMAIVDGVHLAPETSLAAWLTARERLCLVTDAIAAAGMGDGEYALGDRAVRVEGAACRLADGTLAGSVLTMDRAVRNLVALGVGFEDAVAAATVAPARLLRRDDLGVLRIGGPAHVCVLDDRLEVVRTLVGGQG